MSRRKPIPYHVSLAVDAALHENAEAVRSLLPLIKRSQLTPEERANRIAECLHHLYESTAQLKEARTNHEDHSADPK